MKFGRIITRLYCQIRSCIHNSAGECKSCEQPKIKLLKDGKFVCETRGERTTSVALTDEEMWFIDALLSDRYWKMSRNQRSFHEERLIRDISKKLGHSEHNG